MKLCVIEGDGVGHDVVPATVQVLRTILPAIDIHTAQAGWDYFQEHGVPISEETIQTVIDCGALLFGAAASPSYSVPGYYSPVVRLRRELNAHANIRPVRYLPVPTAREGIDLIVMRENTEGVYSNQEETSVDEQVSTAKKVVTRQATERIAHTTYRLARLAKRHLVTIVHKGNVLTQTDGLFRRVAFEVSQAYPDIQTDELLVDTAAYWMVKDPARFDVILTSNQYGDILSDMAAAWGGGLGFIPALSIGDHIAIAEPVHGSAPDISGTHSANPIATILSAALLLRYYWKLPEQAQRIEDAICQTLRAGVYTADVRVSQAVSTQAFTDHVCTVLSS